MQVVVLGAAALAHQEMGEGRPILKPLQDVYLGPDYSNDQIGRLISATGLPAIDYRGREAELLEAVVERLAANEVVGWCQGRVEFGPRALGTSKHFGKSDGSGDAAAGE